MAEAARSSGQPAGTALDTWVIEPRREGPKARLRDVWRYRRLLRFFGVKALQKLYARTYLGWGWLFIRPLFPLLVQTLIFGGMLGVASGGVPYFVFLVTGSSIWQLFAQATFWGTRSLELNRGFLTKIYLPRLILPLAGMTPAFLYFGLYAAVMIVAIVYFGVTDGVWYWRPALVPWALLAMLMATLLALAIALWTSVPAMQARDVRFTVNYVLGFWFFLTPVLYPIDFGEYQWLLAFNPMVGIVNAFKYGVLGIDVLVYRELVTSAITILVVMASGLAFFSWAESDAADKV